MQRWNALSSRLRPQSQAGLVASSKPILPPIPFATTQVPFLYQCQQVFEGFLKVIMRAMNEIWQKSYIMNAGSNGRKSWEQCWQRGGPIERMYRKGTEGKELYINGFVIDGNCGSNVDNISIGWRQNMSKIGQNRGQIGTEIEDVRSGFVNCWENWEHCGQWLETKW